MKDFEGTAMILFAALTSAETDAESEAMLAAALLDVQQKGYNKGWVVGNEFATDEGDKVIDYWKNAAFDLGYVK
jgi:hypothetical protein